MLRWSSRIGRQWGESSVPMPSFRPALDRLSAFPFARLRRLLREATPPSGLAPLDLSIGEPRHQPPAWVADILQSERGLWNRYPPPDGTPSLRRACVAWLERRYRLAAGMLDPDANVLPLAGTKEGLFLLPQLLEARAADGGRRLVLMPEPLYAVYYAAAVLHGFAPHPLPATRATGFLPDLAALTSELLGRTALMFLCSPANPQGAAADRSYLKRLIALCREWDVLLAVDECYADIYDRTPPTGALEVAAEEGDLSGLLVFHSLSKRSSAPGLRSAFVAGCGEVLRRFLHLRSYAAAVQPLPIARAAEALWRDGEHVADNRRRYRRKLDLAERRLAGRFGFYRPEGGFFLWLDVGDGIATALRLWREAALKVLPGSFLCAGSDGGEAGRRYIRLALVHKEEVVEEALVRLVGVLDGGSVSDRPPGVG